MSDRPVRPKYCQYQSVQSGILFFPLSVSWGSTSLVPLIVGISNCSYLLSYIQYIRYCQQEKSRYQTEMNEVHCRCKLWACRSARIPKGFSGRRLNIKRRGGVLLGGTGGGYCVWLFHIKQKHFVQQHSFLCVLTYSILLSTRQTAVAVCRRSDGSDGQPGNLWGFLSD